MDRKKQLEGIIKGKRILQFVNDTRDVAQRYHTITVLANKGEMTQYIKMWEEHHYNPYKEKYKLSEKDASFNVVKYVLNNFVAR